MGNTNCYHNSIIAGRNLEVLENLTNENISIKGPNSYKTTKNLNSSSDHNQPENISNISEYRTINPKKFLIKNENSIKANDLSSFQMKNSNIFELEKSQDPQLKSNFHRILIENLDQSQLFNIRTGRNTSKLINTHEKFRPFTNTSYKHYNQTHLDIPSSPLHETIRMSTDEETNQEFDKTSRACKVYDVTSNDLDTTISNNLHSKKHYGQRQKSTNNIDYVKSQKDSSFQKNLNLNTKHSVLVNPSIAIQHSHNELKNASQYQKKLFKLPINHKITTNNTTNYHTAKRFEKPSSKNGKIHKIKSISNKENEIWNENPNVTTGKSKNHGITISKNPKLTESFIIDHDNSCNITSSTDQTFLLNTRNDHQYRILTGNENNDNYSQKTPFDYDSNPKSPGNHDLTMLLFGNAESKVQYSPSKFTLETFEKLITPKNSSSRCPILSTHVANQASNHQGDYQSLFKLYEEDDSRASQASRLSRIKERGLLNPSYTALSSLNPQSDFGKHSVLGHGHQNDIPHDFDTQPPCKPLRNGPIPITPSKRPSHSGYFIEDTITIDPKKEQASASIHSHGDYEHRVFSHQPHEYNHIEPKANSLHRNKRHYHHYQHEFLHSSTERCDPEERTNSQNHAKITKFTRVSPTTSTSTSVYINHNNLQGIKDSSSPSSLTGYGHNLVPEYPKGVVLPQSSLENHVETSNKSYIPNSHTKESYMTEQMRPRPHNENFMTTRKIDSKHEIIFYNQKNLAKTARSLRNSFVKMGEPMRKGNDGDIGEDNEIVYGVLRNTEAKDNYANEGLKDMKGVISEGSNQSNNHHQATIQFPNLHLNFFSSTSQYQAELNRRLLNFNKSIRDIYTNPNIRNPSPCPSSYHDSHPHAHDDLHHHYYHPQLKTPQGVMSTLRFNSKEASPSIHDSNPGYADGHLVSSNRADLASTEDSEVIPSQQLEKLPDLNKDKEEEEADNKEKMIDFETFRNTINLLKNRVGLSQNPSEGKLMYSKQEAPPLFKNSTREVLSLRELPVTQPDMALKEKYQMVASPKNTHLGSSNAIGQSNNPNYHDLHKQYQIGSYIDSQASSVASIPKERFAIQKQGTACSKIPNSNINEPCEDDNINGLQCIVNQNVAIGANDVYMVKINQQDNPQSNTAFRSGSTTQNTTKDPNFSCSQQHLPKQILQPMNPDLDDENDSSNDDNGNNTQLDSFNTKKIPRSKSQLIQDTSNSSLAYLFRNKMLNFSASKNDISRSTLLYNLDDIENGEAYLANDISTLKFDDLGSLLIPHDIITIPKDMETRMKEFTKQKNKNKLSDGSLSSSLLGITSSIGLMNSCIDTKNLSNSSYKIVPNHFNHYHQYHQQELQNTKGLSFDLTLKTNSHIVPMDHNELRNNHHPLACNDHECQGSASNSQHSKISDLSAFDYAKLSLN